MAAADTPGAPIPADVQALIEKAVAGISVTTDVGKVAECITAVCAVLQTTEGQATMKTWRENSQTVNDRITRAWDAFTGWFK